MRHATAREELASIRALMDESQGFLTGTWPHQLVWGILGCAGLVATWWSVVTSRFGLTPWVWAAVLALGWIHSLVRVRRAGSPGPVRNVATRAFGSIWLALGVTLTLLASASLIAGAMDPRGLPGVIATLFGAGYYASGFLAGLRWLRRVGMAWWVGGAVLLVWQEPESLLVLALMTVCLEIGPALALRRMERTVTAGGR